MQVNFYISLPQLALTFRLHTNYMYIYDSIQGVIYKDMMLP